MTATELLADAVGKWKLYAIILGAAVIYTGVIYLTGHSRGYDEADNKWKASIATSKPVEIRRDTIFVAQDAHSGTFSAVAIAEAGARKRIDAVVRQAMELTSAYQSTVDSLRAINAQLVNNLQLALEPRLIKLSTIELGTLVLKYYPADSTANVYNYQPPPQRVVTVYQERMVLEPQSWWTTAGHVAIGVAIGAVTGYAIAHK